MMDSFSSESFKSSKDSQTESLDSLKTSIQSSQEKPTKTNGDDSDTDSLKTESISSKDSNDFDHMMVPYLKSRKSQPKHHKPSVRRNESESNSTTRKVKYMSSNI